MSFQLGLEHEILQANVDATERQLNYLMQIRDTASQAS